MFVRVLAVIVLALVAAAGLLTLGTQSHKTKELQMPGAKKIQRDQIVPKTEAEGSQLIEKQFGSMVFDKIAEDENAILEVEKNSLSSMIDKDGSVLAAGITRIIIKAPTTREVYFVNAVIAVCGYNGLVILRSKIFDKDGSLVDEVKDAQALMGIDPSSIAGISYLHLCTEALKNAKPEIEKAPSAPPVQRNNTDGRYKNIWI